MSSLNFDSYNVGIICALPIELQALRCSLHKEHPSLPNQPRADRNIYSYGEISGHNIVITCLPKGITGEVSAAHAVTTLSCTFPNLRFGLFIGIGGGIPKLEGLNQADIRLGDIVVSAPEGSHGGVVQYHRGKMVDGEFQRVGALNKPPLLLLNALSSVEALLDFEPGVINEILQSMRGKIKGARRQKLLEYPGRSKDHLFHSFYHHRPNSATCHGLCDLAQTVERDWEEREEDEFEPRVFTGTIASSSVVVKDSRVRDQIQDAYGAKCVEMEAAGVMDFFPCLVIRGISDYADSHKNDDWHRYAALSAAAYGSLLLRNIPAAAVQQLPTTKAVLEEKEKSGDATPLDVYDKPAPTPSREAVLERKGNIEAIPDRQAGLGDKEKAATPLQPHETPVYKPPLDLPGPPKKAPSSKSDGHNVEALPEQAQTPRDKTHDSRTAPSIVVEPSPPDALKRSKTSPVVDEVLLHQPSVGLPNSLERDERPRPSKTTTSQVGDNNPSLTGQQSPRTACVCGAASEKAIPNSSSEAGPKEGLSTASPGVAVPHKTEDAAPPPAPAADTFNKATSSSMLAGFPFDLELEPPMLPESNFAVLTLPLGGSRLQYDRSDRTSTEFKLVPELPFLQTLIFYQTADGEVVVSKGWNCSESGRRRRTPAESIGVRNAKLRTPLTATAYVLGPYNNSVGCHFYVPTYWCLLCCII
ncbi:purine and uridine phosphorylase [Ascobolus immersus RN42]|uniref:Purine and uridine phosphorylase n=1 Tax=Ascobolus immersus RN42 TaxID=1160509 RepID=A0A3N4HNC4_ASCIM|nr:purine and uridine phosphorylase [Ascobolus immersus RN42]